MVVLLVILEVTPSFRTLLENCCLFVRAAKLSTAKAEIRRTCLILPGKNWLEWIKNGPLLLSSILYLYTNGCTKYTY